MQEPVFEKLLPDPYTGPEAKPYTLVIDLDRFLISHQWDAVNARWKVAKRPGADLFLYYMAHLYEVVVFSSLSQFEAEPIMEKLDPYQFISYRLYRFATKYENGLYKKDIAKLNRDLSKVLIFGFDPVFEAFPDNFLKVGPWEGDPADKTLEKSLDFLEALAFSNSPDIRPVIKAFESGQNMLDAYEKRQEDLYESMRQQRMSSNNRFKNWLTSILMPDIAKSSSEIDSLPYQERKAVFMAQRQQDFAKDMERIKKEYQRQMDANKEYLAANKMPLFDLVTKGPPPPPAELIAPAEAAQ